MRRGRGVAGAWLLALVVGATAATPSGAQPRRSARLTFERGVGLEACPGEGDLRDGVAMRLGYDPFQPDAEREVRVSLRRVRGEVTAHVELRAATGAVLGTRDLRAAAASCGELTSAITLAISLAIDPARTAGAPPPQGSAPASPPEPPSPSSPPAPLASPPAPSSPAPPPPVASASSPTAQTAPSAPALPGEAAPVWSASVLAGGGLAFGGGAAALSPEFHGGLALRRGGVWLGAEGQMVLPSRAEVPGGRIETSQLVVRLRPCMAQGPLLLCLALALGGLRGAALDIDGADQQTSLFSTAGVWAGGLVPLRGGVRLLPGAGVEAPLTRTRLNFRENTVWQTGLLGASARLDLVVDLF